VANYPNESIGRRGGALISRGYKRRSLFDDRNSNVKPSKEITFILSHLIAS